VLYVRERGPNKSSELRGKGVQMNEGQIMPNEEGFSGDLLIKESNKKITYRGVQGDRPHSKIGVNRSMEVV